MKHALELVFSVVLLFVIVLAGGALGCLILALVSAGVPT